MTEAILPHGISKFWFWSLQNTKLLFSQTRSSWCELENDNIFHKITADTFAEKMGWDNITLRYNYTKRTQAISFHIFYHRWRDHPRVIREFWTNKHFGRILLANISKQSFLFKFRLIFRNFILLAHHWIIK